MNVYTWRGCVPRCSCRGCRAGTEHSNQHGEHRPVSLCSQHHDFITRQSETSLQSKVFCYDEHAKPQGQCNKWSICPSSFYTYNCFKKYVLSILKSTAYQYYQHHEDEVMLLHGVDEMIISFFTLLSEWTILSICSLYKKPKLFITIEMIK